MSTADASDSGGAGRGYRLSAAGFRPSLPEGPRVSSTASTVRPPEET
jgi:hypothetical protein